MTRDEIYDHLAKLYRFSVKTPWKDLSDLAKRIFLYGVDPPSKWMKMSFTHPEKKTKWTEFVRWKGVLHEAKERLVIIRNAEEMSTGAANALLKTLERCLEITDLSRPKSSAI